MATPPETGAAYSAWATRMRSSGSIASTWNGPSPEAGERLLEAWINGLQGADFELESFRRAVHRALRAHLQEDEGVFDACLRWLEGEVSDRALAKKTDLPVVAKADENLHARRAML